MSEKPLKVLAASLFFLALSATAFAQPVPQFSATPVSGCAPLVVSFQDQSTGSPVQWQWDLGNSTNSTLQNPSTTYLNPGTYTVKLVVTNAAGQKDSIIKQNYITVFALPTVAFTGTPLTGCYPLTVNFTDGSAAGSGSIQNWFWDFGDGTTSTQSNPSHVYTAAGNYNVSLQITNSNGCTKTLTKTNYITISSGVHADFIYSTPTGCTPPETINFTNQSTGTGTLTYEWSFGDGGTSTATNPSHTYTTNGSYSVQLITTNAAGCKDTLLMSGIINIGLVNADFTGPLTACAGNTVSFINTSTPLPVSNSWLFGDGGTSNAANPTHTYAGPGTYHVKLYANFGGCIDSAEYDITIVAGPQTNFTGTPLSACTPPLTVNFTDNTPGAVSYEWIFGDGGTSSQQNPSHTYAATGAYTVTLITTNATGCTDTLVRVDYINIQEPQPAINVPVQGCGPLTHTFFAVVSGSDPVVSYQWDFGDGTQSTAATPTHTFPIGSYNIQLIIVTAGGCRDTVNVPNGVISSTKPTANFSAAPLNTCAEIPVVFTDLSTGTITDWHWDFGDGGTSTAQNPSHQYQDTGYFTVTLVVGNNGCYDTLTIDDYVYIRAPIARFVSTLNCANPNVRVFTDQSIGPDTWSWNFGDGQFSNIQNPTHTYASPGTYTVTLTVTNISTGCSHSTTQNVQIANETPVFSADVTEFCKGGTATFTAGTASGNGALVTGYDWEFGDGGTASGITVSHTYAQAGNYNVLLVITDVNGCRDSLIRPNYIHAYGPTADFNPSVPGSCVASAVVFNDLTVTDGTHPVTQWHWYYGDGIDETLTAPPFAHQYVSPGSYTVQLVVTDSYGCRDSISKANALIISTPVADFSSQDTSSCPNRNINFTNSSTGPGLTYQWSFGDGGTSSATNPTHQYAADGQYDIQLIIIDQYGCRDTLLKPQYIKIASPLALFSVNDSVGTCPPLIVQFTNNSLNGASLIWDFGDGGTSTQPNPSHFYNVAGTYTASLTITSPGGCTSVRTKQISVSGPSGTFSYAPLSGCSPLTVSFTATTQARSSFVWDFNDGNTLVTTDSVFTYTYNLPGHYVPKMILQDAGGCTVPVNGTDTIHVNGVFPDFDADTLVRCGSGPVTFTNNSQSSEAITGYQWNFGDGGTSTDANPTHFYSQEGQYIVTLTATSASGCVRTATATQPVKVVRAPQGAFTQTADGCTPLTASFNASLINPDTSAVTYQWSLSNGAVANTQTFSPPAISIPGVYTAELIVTNSSGCKDTTTNTIEVFALPNVTAGADIDICQNAGETLTAGGAATYTWSPAIGLSCTNCASPVANPPSDTSYVVTGTSSQGCINRDTVRVLVNFPINITYSDNDTICKGLSTTLVASGAQSYVWTPAAGLSSATGATVIATPEVTTTYMVVGDDGKQCFKDTGYITVKVFPLPVVNAGPDLIGNVGKPLTITASVSADVISSVWTPSTGIVSATGNTLVVKPTTDQTYKISVYNSGGCTAEDEVQVKLVCNDANVFIPNTFSPNGDGANDIFYPRGAGLFTIKQLRIFNRWGEEIFTKFSVNANDARAGWDGTYKGKAQNSDVYVYLMELQCENNSNMIMKGNVTLIR